MKSPVIVIREKSDGVRTAAHGVLADGRSLATVGRTVDRKTLSRRRGLAGEPLERYRRIGGSANKAGAKRALTEGRHQVTSFTPEEIAGARAYAEQAGRFDKVVASYRVRDSGAACAQLSWGEYSIEQIEIVLADLRRIERVLRGEEEG